MEFEFIVKFALIVCITTYFNLNYILIYNGSNDYRSSFNAKTDRPPSHGDPLEEFLTAAEELNLH